MMQPHVSACESQFIMNPAVLNSDYCMQFGNSSLLFLRGIQDYFQGHYFARTDNMQASLLRENGKGIFSVFVVPNPAKFVL